jgi:hypothetical protein
MKIHIFFTSAQEVSGQLHAPAVLIPGKKQPGTYSIGDFVDPRAGLNDLEKLKFLTLPGLQLQPLGRPACRQSLYQILYRGTSSLHIVTGKSRSIHFPAHRIQHGRQIHLLLIIINKANSLCIVNIFLMYTNIGKQRYCWLFAIFYISVGVVR